MKKITLIFLILIVPFNSYAFERSLSFSLTSNYVFRGITQTDDKAAAQATYHLEQSEDAGFYAGAFVSNVTKGAEFDVYGGLKLALGKQGKLILDLGAVEYIYTDLKPTYSHDLYIGVEYDLSYIKLYAGEEEARYLDLGLGYPLFAGVEVLFHAGEVFQTDQDGSDYSLSFQKRFNSATIGITATYENKTKEKESELFAFISVDF